MCIPWRKTNEIHCACAQVLLEAGHEADAVDAIARLMTCKDFDVCILQVQSSDGFAAFAPLTIRDNTGI